ncbi:hypothetical protein BDN70DRAFT_845781 [Pholiota conissans]|uniref:BTB domain-containing protein n=1 Tax=Pholiota conissans TaxID=109636 RepID=A0A9P6CSJ5_9AGAR|nr:hypothetical protein BDN70DRAFT_845781 [Pholiota conissans]
MSEIMDAASPNTTSTIFCALNADAVFLSSDNVTFKVHRIYLIANSSVLATEASQTSEVVHLPEAANVLEVLFQFVEPPSVAQRKRQISVLSMQADLFFEVAEASEKYAVYAAMNLCFTRMSMPAMISAYPFQILNHCAKHGYVDLADEAAEKSLSHSLRTAVRKLTAPDVLHRWILYYDHWREAARNTNANFYKEFSLDNPGQGYCPILIHLHSRFANTIDKNPFLFDSIVPSIPSSGCETYKCSPCKILVWTLQVK